MREIRTSGSVGAWGGQPPGLPDPFQCAQPGLICLEIHCLWAPRGLVRAKIQS